MAKKRSIRVQISCQRVEALLEICDEMMEEFAPVNEHQKLLREFLMELQKNLRDMLRRSQEEYVLALSGTEAMAFYQLWNQLDISHDKYATLIVDNLLQKMSRLAA